MSNRDKNLETRFQVETAFEMLIDDIDFRVSRYLKSIQNSGLKKEAMRDVVSGLQIIKSLLENELGSISGFDPRPAVVKFIPQRARQSKPGLAGLTSESFLKAV